MGTYGGLCGGESRDGLVVFGVGSECGGWWRGSVSGWWVGCGGGQARGGWINESVYLVSVGGWVCVGLGPGLDSMSPARSRRSASPKNWAAGPPERRGRWIQFAQCSPEQSPRLWHCGTPTTSRLYPFGAVPPNSPPDCGTVAHQPRAGCIRLVPPYTFIYCI